MTVTIELAVVVMGISLISGVIAIIGAISAWREKKNMPFANFKEEFEAYKTEHEKLHAECKRDMDAINTETDRKLDNDKRKIEKLEIASDSSDAFQRVVLSALKGILKCMTAPTAEEISKVENEIDQFLIHKNL
ncbi:MAG: hypothetical protein FWD23_07260 [Oscillospiraceae bacterium]|nr:hypothetical protein [Oscillospiraceae bacterium]